MERTAGRTCVVGGGLIERTVDYLAVQISTNIVKKFLIANEPTKFASVSRSLCVYNSSIFYIYVLISSLRMHINSHKFVVRISC